MTRGLWDREMVAALLIAAVLPLALAWLWYGGGDALGRLLLALVISGAWHLVFMLARAQPPSLSGALAALAVAMLAPEGLGLFQLFLGISFGAVMGELVFGGWGRNVVHPATVTLAFLGFGFPAYPWPDFVLPIAWAAIPALALGTLMGVMAAGAIGGAALVAVIALLAGADLSTIWPAALIVLALLVCDPVASASTALGRWLYGALFATLLILFALNWHGAAPVQMAVAAALLASLAAPALDSAAIALWLARRRRAHARP